MNVSECIFCVSEEKKSIIYWKFFLIVVYKVYIYILYQAVTY
jgi:hypothetical protein